MEERSVIGKKVSIHDDRYSTNKLIIVFHVTSSCQNGLLQFEPRSEKTGLRGFPPGPTQTGLYNHRSWLEA